METAHYVGRFHLWRSDLCNPTLTMTRTQTLGVASGFLLLLLTTLLIYQPARTGGLVFDDIPNLKFWAEIGDIRTLTDLLRLSFSSIHIPGRPLSLASFAIDDQSWPLVTDALKRTNILIHLLNTTLVFALSRRLLRRHLPTAQAQGLALAITALWALHPMQASNVAYIIQRMNLLSTTVTLLALILFCKGREQLESAPIKGLMTSSIAIGVLGPIAILFKENGALICVFALLIERFFYRLPPASRPGLIPMPLVWHLWKAVALWLPLALLLSYCVWMGLYGESQYVHRTFSSGERLLTQGPVLTDYLRHLLMPRLQGTGLYFDNYPVARHITFSVALCWALIIGLLGLAWALRNRLPLVSFGLSFFFAGHLLESTNLPLELYFEHRNYLPQWGLWISLGSGLFYLARHQAVRPTVLASASILILMPITWITWEQARLWGDSDQQAAIWYHENPGSMRAALAYIRQLQIQGNAPAAKQVMQDMEHRHPDYLAPRLATRYWNCLTDGSAVVLDDLLPLAQKANYEVASISMLLDINKRSMAKTDTPCPHTQPAAVETILRALLSNPHFALGNTQSNLNMELGEIAATRGDLNSVMAHYDAAGMTSSNPVYPYRQAKYLHSAGLEPESRQYLARAERLLTFRYRLLYPELETRVLELKQELGNAHATLSQ